MGACALRRWLAWVALLWVACAGVCLGWGQTSGGAVLRGELRDGRGERLAGAGVRLVSADTGQGVVAGTDGGGLFGFLSLAAGEYVASVRLAMMPVWVGSVRVRVEAGEVADLQLQLRDGPERMELTASGEEGVVVAGRPGPGFGGKPTVRGGQVVSGALGVGAGNGAEALPVPGREWEVLAEVSSSARDGTLAGGGAAQDATEGEETASVREERETGSASTGLSFDGLPVVENRQAVDGLPADQGFRSGPRGAALGGARAGSGFAEAAVGRLRASARTYSAQGGGAAGGTVSVASRGVDARSRSGLHGDAFFQAREAAWGAVNPYAVVTSYRAGAVTAALARPADSQLQFGAAAGVPVQVPGMGERGRLGLFGTVEARERRQTLFSSPETAGFYQLSSTQRALLANRGVRTGEIAAALGYLSGLSGPESLRGAQWLSFGRVDWSPGRWDRVSVSYAGLRSATPATGGGQTADGVINRALGSVGTSAIVTDAGTVRWVHVLGPRWTNELRAQLARDNESETPGPGSAGVPAIGPGGFAPQVAIAPQGFSYGTPASLGRLAYPDERRIDVADTSLWRFGRHLVSVGGSWSRLDDKVLGATNLEGSFLYDSGTTGGHAGGLVDWITDYTFNVHAYPNGGCPSVTAAVHYFCFRSYSQSFADAETEFETHDIAGFAEDAVRLRANLQLTLGARWEYQLLPFPLAPNTALDAALLTGGASGLSAYGVTSSFPEDRNNVGPRVALTWSPGGTSGRRGAWFTGQAGYGMFFGRLPGATLNAALTDTGVVQSTTSIRITPTVETACPQVANQGFGYPCSFQYAPAGVAEVAQTGAVTVFSKRFRLPAVQRASFAVERELGRVQLRGEYATAWAVQLPETTDLNIAPSTDTVSYVVQGGDGRPGLRTGQSFRVPRYTARRTTKFGPVTAIESNANATYHSGTAEVILRPWHGWGARGGYTFSKALDYGPLLGATPRQDGQFDPFTNGFDKARSSLDRPWQAAGAVSYRSTWGGDGGEWARQLLGGWGLGVIGRAGNGAPYSYVVFGGTRLSGGHESINGSGGATYLPTVGRNTLRLPMRSKLDVRASREVTFRAKGERDWRLDLRADAFNVLNTVSVSRVETRAFLLGDEGSVGGMTPLVFQDAATVAAEGLSTPAFGAALSSTTGLSRERTIELGARLRF